MKPVATTSAAPAALTTLTSLQRDCLGLKGELKECRAHCLKTIQKERAIMQRDLERVSRIVVTFVETNRRKNADSLAVLKKEKEALRTTLANEYDALSSQYEAAEEARKATASMLLTGFGKTVLLDMLSAQQGAAAAMRAVSDKATAMIKAAHQSAQMANAASAFVAAALERSESRVASLEAELGRLRLENASRATELDQLRSSHAAEVQRLRGDKQVLLHGLSALAASMGSFDASITAEVRLGLHGAHAQLGRAVMGTAVAAPAPIAGEATKGDLLGSVMRLADESLLKTERTLMGRGIVDLEVEVDIAGGGKEDEYELPVVQRRLADVGRYLQSKEPVDVSSEEAAETGADTASVKADSSCSMGGAVSASASASQAAGGAGSVAVSTEAVSTTGSA